MRLLLDTHCWLWWLAEPERLNAEALAAVTDRRNALFLSAASAWEIAIKVGLGKLTLPGPPSSYVPSRLAEDGISSLPIEQRHALQVAELPHLHRDPFDRLLVAQALVEDLVLLTADPEVARYPVELLWAGLGMPAR
jgi:PIN domain nuclease of toxin-antitoxin system